MRLNRMHDDSGGIAVIAAVVMFALALPMMILVIDGGGLFTERRQLQNASDAGAYAAAKWCSNLPLLSTCDEASAYDQAVPFVTGNDAFDKKDNDGVSFDSDSWYLCGTAVAVECTDTDPDPAVEYYSKYDCPPVTAALLTGRPFVQVRVISGNGGWTGVISDSSTAVFACSRAILDPPVENLIHHDAISHIVHHDEVSHVVHHAEESHIVHHDEVSHIVKHDAVTHEVTHEAVTHIEHHLAITHDVNHPAEFHTVVHPDITQVVHHEAVTHTVTHPAETHTVTHPEVSHIVSHPPQYPTSGPVLSITISKCDWTQATNNGSRYGTTASVTLDFQSPNIACLGSNASNSSANGGLSQAKGTGTETVSIGDNKFSSPGAATAWKGVTDQINSHPAGTVWLIPIYDKSGSGSPCVYGGSQGGTNVCYNIIGFSAFVVTNNNLSPGKKITGYFVTTSCGPAICTSDPSQGNFGVYVPGWDEKVIDSPEWVETIIDRPAWTETVVDVPAYDETIVISPSWVETIIDKPAWTETIVDVPAYDETIVDTPAWQEVIVDEPAWEETVVDQPGWDETIVDAPAWDETVVDQDGWDEVIIDKAAWDESTYTPSGTASMVL